MGIEKKYQLRTNIATSAIIPEYIKGKLHEALFEQLLKRKSNFAELFKRHKDEIEQQEVDFSSIVKDFSFGSKDEIFEILKTVQLAWVEKNSIHSFLINEDGLVWYGSDMEVLDNETQEKIKFAFIISSALVRNPESKESLVSIEKESSLKEPSLLHEKSPFHWSIKRRLIGLAFVIGSSIIGFCLFYFLYPIIGNSINNTFLRIVAWVFFYAFVISSIGAFGYGIVLIFAKSTLIEKYVTIASKSGLDKKLKNYHAALDLMKKGEKSPLISEDFIRLQIAILTFISKDRDYDYGQSVFLDNSDISILQEIERILYIPPTTSLFIDSESITEVLKIFDKPSFYLIEPKNARAILARLSINMGYWNYDEETSPGIKTTHPKLQDLITQNVKTKSGTNDFMVSILTGGVAGITNIIILNKMLANREFGDYKEIIKNQIKKSQNKSRIPPVEKPPELINESISENEIAFSKIKDFTYDRNSNRISINKSGKNEKIRVDWILNYSVEIEHIIGNDFIQCKKDWRIENFVKIPFNLNPSKFLTDGDLKSIVPGESRTLKEIEPKLNILGPWIEFLLSHPNQNVVLETIDFIATELFTAHYIRLDLAALMIVGSEAVKNKIGQKFWEKYKSKDEKEEFLDLLSNRGMMPAGFPVNATKVAGQIIRKHCPSSEEESGKQLILEYFGAAVAGVKLPKKKGVLATYTRTETKQSQWGLATYKFHTAKNLADARAFLDAINITEDLLYYEVETPEGNVGKDKMGIY